MLYRAMGNTGDRVSILGYGCMRFPKKNMKTDEERTAKQIISAIEQGVNYFDTAYLYPQSEAILGKILAQGYRDKVMIATKLPPIHVHGLEDMDAILATQLKRLQTDYIDYYLMHSLTSMDAWQRIKELGVEEFLQRAKESGKINRIGFSYHGDKKDFKKIVDDYPWDFCQIQYNYMDENAQAGKEGLVYAAAKGLGIAVMEPLRGGLLAREMPPRVKSVFEKGDVKRTPAEWALRWVWSHPEVSVLLSGMNEEWQIEENIRIANEAHPNLLTERELKTIDEVKELLSEKLKVGCTGCGYCMPCPAGLNIPMCFSYYNDRHIYEDKLQQRISYMLVQGGMDGGTPSYASLCSDCGKCERECPQHLPVRKHLKEVAKEMEGLYFKPVVKMIGGYYNVRKRLRRGKQ